MQQIPPRPSVTEFWDNLLFFFRCNHNNTRGNSAFFTRLSGYLSSMYLQEVSEKDLNVGHVYDAPVHNHSNSFTHSPNLANVPL